MDTPLGRLFISDDILSIAMTRDIWRNTQERIKNPTFGVDFSS